MTTFAKRFGLAVLAVTLSSSSGALAQDAPIGILLAAGDIAGCFQGDRQYEEVAGLLDHEVATANERGLPVGILVLGDVAYADPDDDDPTYAECLADFDRTWGKHKSIMYPVPGNHDYTDDPRQGRTYAEYFADRLQGLGAGDALNYAVRFPHATEDAWLLAGINYYRRQSSQRSWLRTTLDETSAKCALLFSHPFVMSSGDHGQEEGDWTIDNMARFFAIGVERGADVFVGAHDHDYERFAPLDGDLDASGEGMRSFVAGTGGAHLYDLDGTDRAPHSDKYIDDRAGLLKLELSAAGYAWSFLGIDGAVLDSGTGTCRP